MISGDGQNLKYIYTGTLFYFIYTFYTFASFFQGLIDPLGMFKFKFKG